GTRSRGALPGRIGRSRRRSNRNPFCCQPVSYCAEDSRVCRLTRLHIFRDRGDLLPTALGDDDAPALKLLGQSRIVFVGWPQGGERLVEMLITKIPRQRAVDVLLFGIDVPGL